MKKNLVTGLVLTVLAVPSLAACGNDGSGGLGANGIAQGQNNGQGQNSTQGQKNGQNQDNGQGQNNGGEGSATYCSHVRSYVSDMNGLKSRAKPTSVSGLRSAINPIVDDTRKAADTAPDADAKAVWTFIGDSLEKVGNGDKAGVTELQSAPAEMHAKVGKVTQDVKGACGIDLSTATD